MIEYPSRLDLARLPTPLTRMERLSTEFPGVDIWLKHDEMTGVEVSGNKVRKLEFIFAEALAQGCDTVITCGGVQSNHCRATAVLAARLGLKAHLLLRGERPPELSGNLLLDHLSGAEISYISQADWRTHEEYGRELQDEYERRGRRALFIPIGGSDAIGLWGYIAACEELRKDFDRSGIEPDAIVVATGSGGTQSGLLVGRELFGLRAGIVAFNVCDDAAWFEQKVRRDVAAWSERYDASFDVEGLAIATIEGYVGPGYGEAGPEVYRTIASVARREGVFLDPVYTGKAFNGMLSELRKGDSGCLAGAGTVVFIHTGGLFGVFPHQRQFKETLIDQSFRAAHGCDAEFDG